MKQVSELVEAGTEPLSTLIESKATYSRDIQNLTLAENNHDLSLLNLAQLLQLKSDNFDIQVIKIDTPSANLLYNDINTILDYALTNRNEIKVAERDVELAKLGTKIGSWF